MAIIINDFEIIIEDPPENEELQDNPPEEEEHEQEKPGLAALRPEDIASVIRFYQERAERLLAD